MNIGYEAIGTNRYKFHRSYIRSIEESIYPFLKVVDEPAKYPYYTGGLEGFDATALPRTWNPIIAAKDDGAFEVLNLEFLDGEKANGYKPQSDGHVYREFIMDKKDGGIVAFADIEPSGSPTFNQVMIHCDLGYLGIRKVKLVDAALNKELLKYDVSIPIKRTINHYAFWEFYRHLNIEEQGLSTNLKKENANFMPGCKMHRMLLVNFLERFPFGDNSPLIADWDYGYTEETGPARDEGHVDIKLNPLWLSKEKPWSGKIINMDAEFYRDMLNGLLRDNKDLWTQVDE